MYHHVTVTRPRTPLEREVWGFTLLDLQIVLDSYVVEVRASKRHRFVPGPCYGRLNRRDSFLALADVPLPDDVAEEAHQQIITQIRVVREYDRAG